MEQQIEAGALRVGAYKVCREGLRGATIRLPKAWVEDVGVERGDPVSLYKDSLGRLIVAKGSAPTLKTHDGFLAVKFRNYRASRKDRYFMLTIPKQWLEEVNYVPGEALDMLRDHESRLILTRAGGAA